MPDEPSIVVGGFGVADTLQLTIETMRSAQRAGHVLAVSPPPNLVDYLTANRVRVVDLTDGVTDETPYVDAYLQIVDTVLRQAEVDPPAVLLVPGSPLFFDNLTRFLVETARERGSSVRILPGTSPIDAIVAELGIDVGARGLQIVDARSLVASGQVLSMRTPAVVTGIDALVDPRIVPAGTDPDSLFRSVAAQLTRSFADDHLASVVTPGTPAKPVTSKLATLERLRDVVRPGSLLFIDAVRPPSPQSD
jgi:hypothetical protein